MSGRGTHKTGQQALAAISKQERALNLRKAGATYDQIAEQVGYKDRSGAYKAVRKAILDLIQEPAREVKKLEDERLDRMLASVWMRALDGDLNAVDRVLKIMERRSRLHGLDAPSKLIHADIDARTGSEREKILKELWAQGEPGGSGEEVSPTD